MILFLLVLLDIAAVQEALPHLPSPAAARAMLLHWGRRVKFLEEGQPFYDHKRHEYAKLLQHARNARWAWDKVDDIVNPHYTWRYRRECLEQLRKRGTGDDLARAHPQAADGRGVRILETTTCSR